MKYALIPIIIMILVPNYAVGQPPNHRSDLCYYCHNRFSSTQPYAENLSAPVLSSGVKNEFPCNKKECHDTTGTRNSLHISPKVCENCHPNVHLAHKDEVDCRICHMSPKGWNSSLAIMPAPNEQFIYEDLVIWIPESSECGFCHFDAEGHRNIHEAHKSILENNNTCVECHGEVGAKPKYIAEILGNKVSDGQRKNIIVTELIEFLDGIGKELMNVITSLQVG